MRTIAIIPAAGLGTRMGKPRDSRKQFLALGDTPILVRTIRKFVNAESIFEVFVAVRDEDRAQIEELLNAAGFAKPVRLAAGGVNRQESVKNCLEAAPPDADVVAVHDAVRPFVTPKQIDEAVAHAAEEGAVILGLPAIDTVKQVDQKRVHATIPRERIMLAQTPQVFRTALLKQAYEQAEQDGFVGTDEASLIEHLGEDVHVMLGSERNIKITRPSDLELAKFYLEIEEREAADS